MRSYPSFEADSEIGDGISRLNLRKPKPTLRILPSILRPISSHTSAEVVLSEELNPKVPEPLSSSSELKVPSRANSTSIPGIINRNAAQVDRT
jgi:hypothetical protein